MTQAVKAGEHLQQIEFTSRAQLRAWLVKNATNPNSIWCVTWKKRPGAPHVAYAAIVEECICFGWIDSLPRTLDAERSMILLSPRKPGSNWSKLNRERAERMIAQGLMTQAGLQKVNEAKASGAWSFLDDVDALVAPPDLQAALAQAKGARKNWDAFPPSARRGILEWIKNAKTDETRGRRIQQTAFLAAQNVRANQYRQVLPGAGRTSKDTTRAKSKA